MIFPTSTNAVQKTLDAQLLSGATASMTLNSVTGIQNKEGVCVIDAVDANGTATPAKREYIKFTGVSGSTLTGLTRNADGGSSDQDHAVGAIVQFGPDVLQQQAIIDSLLTEHNEDGTHKSATVTTLKATGAEINTGTEDAKIVTPKAIADSDISFPTKVESLKNKSIYSCTFSGIINGWIYPDETWTYVSTDDPTGIFKVNANVTTKYSVGMKIKFTNGGNIIHGIITAVGTYEGDEAGYTYITFLHQIDPTDNLALYLMANSAITSPYYSTAKSPQGFPSTPASWSIVITDVTARGVDTPSSTTWYNIGTTNSQISLPIGDWLVSYKVELWSQIAAASAAGIQAIKATLSTANNSESDSKNSNGFYTSSLDLLSLIKTCTMNNIPISVTAKTIYYLNGSISSTDVAVTKLWFYNSYGALFIRAVCAYL